MASDIDVIIKKLEVQNEKLLGEARKRYDRFKKLADNPRSPVEKRGAERNMQIVLGTLADSQSKHKAILAKLNKLKTKR
ncbi:MULTISPECIES: hypothetical protein [Bradyrhizobium]|uniref:Transcriptional regulator n=2 Tax=Bradyrhizobium TaxID=374 RepID=A0ABY0QG84_9BRAD|nr:MULTISPECIES: hypothetical protein [Bradyrhizobium]SDK27866.1 hypothetical protein SAMN05444163_7706 [Bradyrhizobium ottawaense]SEE42551.1 hypothetical protein SAMN05444171_7428 [Bradyrhizobium lablabi]